MTLEDFEAVSNSEMVYACDELGNQIAVGVIVSNSCELPSDEKKITAIPDCESVDFPASANDSWVGAMEECGTETIENVESDEKCDAEIPIRLYKVNKGRKSTQPSEKRIKGTLQTLAEMKSSKRSSGKKKKVESTAKFVKSRPTKLEGKEGDVEPKKKFKARKKKTDKLYPVPSRLRKATFKRKTFFILF